MGKLFNEKEVAEMLTVSVHTIRDWRMTRGRGPKWIKVGRLVRYEEVEIKRYLERCRRESA